jgi:hypothetical protein
MMEAYMCLVRSLLRWATCRALITPDRPDSLVGAVALADSLQERIFETSK